MNVIELLVEELKKRSIDLTLWHKDLLSKAFEMDNYLTKKAYNEGYENGFKDGSQIKIKEFELSKQKIVDTYLSGYENGAKDIDDSIEFIDECKCFRLGEGSPWQTYLCEIHKEK